MAKEKGLKIVSKIYETTSGEKIRLNITDEALAKVCDFKHGDYIRRNNSGFSKSVVIGIYNNKLYVIEDNDYNRTITIIVFSKDLINKLFDKIDETPPSFKKYKTKLKEIYVKEISYNGLCVGNKIQNIESGAEGKYVGLHPFFGKERPCILYDIYKMSGVIGWTDFEDLDKI